MFIGIRRCEDKGTLSSLLGLFLKGVGVFFDNSSVLEFAPLNVAR